MEEITGTIIWRNNYGNIYVWCKIISNWKPILTAEDVQTDHTEKDFEAAKCNAKYIQQMGNIYFLQNGVFFDKN